MTLLSKRRFSPRTLAVLSLGALLAAPSCAEAAKSSSQVSKRPAQTTKSSAQAVEHLPTTSSLQIPFSVFKSPETTVIFKYPRGWKPEKTTEKDTIVKFTGTTGNGLSGDISLGHFSDASVKAETARHVVEDVLLSKLPNFKKIQEKTIAIGPSRKLVGYLQDVSFTYNGMDASQRWVFFDAPGGTNYLTFTAQSTQFNGLIPVYNEVLISVQTGGAGAVATAGGQASGVTGIGGQSAGSGAASDSSSASSDLIRYQSATLPVTFSYPTGWHVVEEEPAGDKALQITGQNKAGQSAELTIYRGANHPWASTEQLADAIEKEFYQPQEGFRRVNRQLKDFGNMSKISGVVQENSFKYKGQPVKQLVAIFEHNDKAYAMSLISPGWKESEMQQLFHRVLATMSVKD